MKPRGHRVPWTASLVVVGAIIAASAVAQPAPKGASGPININTATAAELQTLPGIDAGLAAKIIAGRPYRTASDLARTGILPGIVMNLTPRITFEPAPPAKPVTQPEVKPAEPKVEKPVPAPAKPTPTPEAKPAAPVVPLTEVKAPEAKPVAKPAAPPVEAKPAKPAEPKVEKQAPPAKPAEPKIEKPAPPAKPAEPKVEKPAPPAKPAKTPPAVKPVEPEKAKETPAPADPAKLKSADFMDTGGLVTKRTPPAKGMVWVDTGTGLFYTEGDRRFGATQEGKFMSREDALKAGYFLSKTNNAGPAKK
jgi:hypothetical protein